MNKQQTQIPCRKIKNKEDINIWKETPAYYDIKRTFYQLLNSVQSKSRKPKEKSRNIIIQELLEIFSRLKQYLNETEIITQKSIFRNKGFCQWLFKVKENAHELFSRVTNNEEVIYYFTESFGNLHRVDFGTGHEFNFLAFITILNKIYLLSEEDSKFIVFNIFWEYWNLIYQVINKFQVAPAGSHGAWGINDYLILPFVFGSSQLIGNSEITPSNINEETISTHYKEEFCYCMSISHLHHCKYGNFETSSRMLNSLRYVPNFETLREGMVKLYFDEVVNNFFVVQQFGFGELLKWESKENNEENFIK